MSHSFPHLSLPPLSRRQFLKLAGLIGLGTLPLALGYRWFTDDSASVPLIRSPYAHDSSWSVTAPVPILLLVNDRSDNPFGTYLAEILRAEGLNLFRTMRLSSVAAATLASFAVVILSEGTTLTHAESEMLSAYVAAGGRLIAMRPEASALFGIEAIAGTAPSTNIQIEPPYAGNVDVPLQIHDTAKLYRLAGAQAIAWLTDDKGTRRDTPAITLHRFGQGQTAAWSFDLAKSIAYTRQGNPAWVNQERDGRDGIRAVDAFVDWIDLDRIQIPQADEQMRLLSRLIAEMLAEVMPLPRLWYLPSKADCLLILTGDAHQTPATAIEQVLARVERYDGRMTIYYTPRQWSGWQRALAKIGVDTLTWLGNQSDEPTPAQVAEWRARGHEFGFHPYVEDGLESGYRHYWQEFVAHGYQPVSPTVRTHRILWTGWVETARAQAHLGLRMNLDYYHYGTAFRHASGAWVYGYFTGSGLPMKFVDEQGRLLDIYQQTTHLVDEHLFRMTWGGGWANLDGKSAVVVSQALIEASRRGVPAAIGMQVHLDPFAAGGEFAANAWTWLEGTLAYAAANHVPIWSAERWLQFSDVRHEALFEQIVWNTTTRSLLLRVAVRGALETQMDVMIPARFNGLRVAQVQVDGQATPQRLRHIGNEEFVCVAVPSGTHTVISQFG